MKRRWFSLIVILVMLIFSAHGFYQYFCGWRNYFTLTMGFLFVLGALALMAVNLHKPSEK